MKTQIETIKADLYNVFVMGNANNRQLGRVYFLLATPVLALMLVLGLF